MKEPYRETIVSTSSTKFIAGQKMAARPPVKVTELSGLAPQIISHNRYRIELNVHAGVKSIFYCPETGIKIEVENKTILEYSLEYRDEHGNDYSSLIQEHGCELLGPIFNVQVISGEVSAVYLPHYVCLDGFRDKSVIKFGHLKDGKVFLQIPSRVDPSYVVLDQPTFSCVAPIGEYVTSIWRRKKPYPFNGKVVLYARVLCADNEKLKEFRIHLYLIPTDRHRLEKLDDWKELQGFKNINKPGAINNVFTKTNYIINGKPTSNIWPETLQFTTHKEIEEYAFSEINISHSAEEISLKVKTEKSPDSEPLWKGLLTRDIEELSGQAAQRADPPDHVIDRHRVALIQKIRHIEPVLDDLKRQNLLSEEACGKVTSKGTSQDKMREIFRSVDSWGWKDKDKFYQVLKMHDKPIIKEIGREK
ncbi:NACHT, LRR and PYD domains-containing protein 1b allele 3-like isoform X2 [Phyllobates terribilis]|uniref:NACHT, LRR and PYD domains-containing protein 1b allele 3-like isoform X2 n=1 Tax=Phyllobates terribilis TaxID=111132 RepID=UPI003CCB50E0